MKIEQNKQTGILWIRKPVYIEKLLKRLRMQGSKPTSRSQFRIAASQTEPVNQAELQ